MDRLLERMEADASACLSKRPPVEESGIKEHLNELLSLATLSHRFNMAALPTSKVDKIGKD